jgi:hypothetical protein
MTPARLLERLRRKLAAETDRRKNIPVRRRELVGLLDDAERLRERDEQVRKLRHAVRELMPYGTESPTRMRAINALLSETAPEGDRDG